MGVDESHFQFCTACKTRSPEIETNYTLISAKFGWRLLRTRGEKGDYLLQWYCPKCWAKRKDGPDSAR